MTALHIRSLSVETKDKRPVLSDISLQFEVGKRYAILGPNGAGKSSLVNAIMSHPHYDITAGQVLLDGADITHLPTDEKARRGLFIGSQYPAEVEGVSFSNFMRTAIARQTDNQVNFFDFLKDLKRQAAALGFKNFDPQRDLGVGFSGGEKKRSEILQMLALKPSFAFLDEPDSGLDVDGVATLGNTLAKLDFPVGLVVITHHHKALAALKPDVVYILKNGRLAATGSCDLVKQVQANGFKGPWC
ncbi:MAG: Fe-S cluster assembly ATPase SufC [Candidatus Nomurabacteria bacterium]|nr:Fe-S cluster assembly ATPase SufC [Candidatus Nomurabacteria bacterium]